MAPNFVETINPKAVALQLLNKFYPCQALSFDAQQVTEDEIALSSGEGYYPHTRIGALRCFFNLIKQADYFLRFSFIGIYGGVVASVYLRIPYA